MTREDDKRLKGRHAEFARMSLRPGLGAGAMLDVAEVSRLHGLADYGDVAAALQHGKSILPLGKYLRTKLRLALGLGEKATDAEIAAAKERMRPMLEAVQAVQDGEVYLEGQINGNLLASLVRDQGLKAEAVLEARRKLYERGKK